MSILSEDTIQLIQQRNDSSKNDIKKRLSSVEDIIDYLQKFKVHTETVANFSIADANLRLRILIELNSSYGLQEPRDESNNSLISKLKLAFLALIGTAYHICNGFAGGASILSLFLGVPAWAILAVGIFLSLVYLLLFLYIDLVTIADNLNVKFYKSRKLIDIYLEQETYLNLLIQNIKRQIEYNNNEQTKLALKQQHQLDVIQNTKKLEETLQALINEKATLVKIADTYNVELDKSYVKALKLIFPLFTDALFFSYGFFTGEAMITIISAAFGTSLAIASGPGVILCIFAGLAALSLYWLNDRLNVENLIGIWVGLDLQKIKLLPKAEQITEDENNLHNLENTTQLLEKIPVI